MADYNAIFKKWNEQVSSTSGAHVPCKFGYEIYTPMALHATIGVNAKGGDFYRTIPCPSRTYEAPWLERLTTADVKVNAQTIGEASTFDAVQGTFKRWNLDTQLSVTKTIPGIEQATLPYDYAGHWVAEEARILSIISEDKFVQTVIDNCAKGSGTARTGHEFDVDMVVKDSAGDVDYYKTVGRAIRYATEQGWHEEDMVIYVSPKIAEAIMSKGILGGNLAQSSAGFETMLHKNMLGVIQNIPVIRVPRLSIWEKNATNPVDMLVCNKAHIFKMVYIRTPLMLTPAPEDHLDRGDRLLKHLSWLEWGVEVENAAFFINSAE